MTDASWHPDPTGRHEMRYWDGQLWTESVSDGGEVTQEPPTWTQPPDSSGLGLRSGQLRYAVLPGSGQWPVMDGSGAQVGWVVRGPFALGGRSAQVWDLQTLWLTVKQSMHGTLVLRENLQIGQIGWHGVGAMSTVNISLELAGRVRARMLAKQHDLRSGTATVKDPSGTDLLTLKVERVEDSKILTIQRLVSTPDEYENIIQAMVPAIILELNNRVGFDPTHRNLSGNGVWPD